MKLIVFVLFFVISLCGGVDRYLYKTCAQSSFCRRSRGVSGPSRYEVVPSSISSNSDGTSLDIRNNENQILFVLRIRALQVWHCVIISYQSLYNVSKSSRTTRSILK